MLASYRGLIRNREPKVPLAAVVATIFGAGLGADRRLRGVAEIYAEKRHEIENPTLWFLAALQAADGGPSGD